MRTILCALTAALLAGPALLGAAHARDNGSGPTSEQIYCQNRAVNDYWDQVKACDQSLSDIPDQLALCKSDATADLSRAKAACTTVSRTGGMRPVLGGGGVFERVR